MRARAAAALIGALAAAGCATTESASLGIGDVDEDGCVLTARVARAVQPRRVNDPVDATASSGREQALDSARGLDLPSVAPRADKVVRSELYVDSYTCPKITIPEKPRE